MSPAPQDDAPPALARREHLGPAAPQQVELPWHARINVLTVVTAGFAVAVLLALPGIRGSGRDLDTWGNVARFVDRFLPPDWSVLPVTLGALVETLRIAVVATAVAMVLSVPVAAAAARSVSPRPLVAAARFLLNGIRTVPSLVWALFAVAVVGANPLAGVIALAIYSMGYLGKFYSDALETVDPDVPQALRAGGADAVQVFQYGVWPAARAIAWSQTLWMLEYNVRAASIVGLVGAGGLGVQLHAYAEFGQWDKFATVLLSLLVVVTALDLAGESIRRRITKRLKPR